DTPGGVVLGEITVHPVSLPGSLPGNTTSPLLVLAGVYIRVTDSSCAGVRQPSPSAPLHRSVAGSKRHDRGSLINPSLTPSRASHASSAALFSRASFAAGTALAGSLSAGIATLRSHAWRCV